MMKALNELLVLDEEGRTWVDLEKLSEESGVSVSRLKRSAWRAQGLRIAEVATRLNRTVVLRQDIDLALSFLKSDEHTLRLRQACYAASRTFRTGKPMGRPTISREKRQAILAGLAAGKTPYRMAKETGVAKGTAQSLAKAARTA